MHDIKNLASQLSLLARNGRLVDWQVYLGADSDRITYTQAVVGQPGAANAGLAAGTVQYSTAVTTVTWSDKP